MITIAVLLSACGADEPPAEFGLDMSQLREKSTAFDGTWELVDFEFPGVGDVGPLTLTINNRQTGGNDGCNSFHIRPNGVTTGTLVRCRPEVQEFTRALQQAVITTPEVIDGNLVFSNHEISLTYAPWVDVLTSELFAVIDSDAPNLDSTTIAFEQTGKPLRYERFIRLDDGGHEAEFYIGYKAPDGLAFHIDIVDDPKKSRTLGALARAYRKKAPSHFAADVRAALIPDGFLEPDNIRALTSHGELHGNLLIFDAAEIDGTIITLLNATGDELTVVVPSPAQ